MKAFTYISFVILFFSFSCKNKEKVYELNTITAHPANAGKDKLKTNEQYISILYANLFQTALVAPIVDFGKLEEVLIILSPRSEEAQGSIVNALTPETEVSQIP